MDFLVELHHISCFTQLHKCGLQTDQNIVRYFAVLDKVPDNYPGKLNRHVLYLLWMSLVLYHVVKASYSYFAWLPFHIEDPDSDLASSNVEICLH